MATRIKAELLLASKNDATGDILYTMRFTYPRIVLAEVNTHRAFSRNTSSSRAIPGKRVRGVVKNDPFVPTHIGAAKKGMQAGAELQGWRRAGVELVWKLLRYPNVLGAWLIELLGAHKQIANRVLEPWLWVTQIVSATDIQNFLKLRAHEMAEPHLNELAQQVKAIVAEVNETFFHLEKMRFRSSGLCQILLPGQWHLPLVQQSENSLAVYEKKLISAARSARTSYTLIEGGAPDTRKDYGLGRSLVEADPLHASPLEHQAQAQHAHPRRYFGNFKGWMQYRFELEGDSAKA